MDTKELNALKDRAYKTAIAHGFHEEERPDAYWLGLVMSEMGEAISAYQKGDHADMESFEKLLTNEHSFNHAYCLFIKDDLEDELADIVIRLLDFAGLKGYELDITSMDHVFSTQFLLTLKFENYKLPWIFFNLIGALYDAVNKDETYKYVGTVICVLSDCFAEMSGSDKDLWYFVEKKMKYNELRPNSKGEKKY